MKKINKSFSGPFLLLLCTLLVCSCASTRPAVYFADEPDSATVRNLTPPKTYIQPNDILSISVSSINPQATLIFNSPNIQSVAATGSAGGTLQTPGYLVNPEGYIQFPVLGDIKVSGLTTDDIRKQISQSLVEKKLLIDPIVMVRQLNFKVSVLGEVGHPTVINVPSEKISLLEALGLAGDITIYGRKDNVLIIREEGGVKKIKHIDLNSDELFTSPYYYLKSNDIVLVSANKNKIASTSRSNQILPIVFSALSLVAIVIEGLVYKH
jgi:polysaccharide export outer membrane protein